MKDALTSQLGWLQMSHHDLKEHFQPPGGGGGFEENFCEAVTVPDVKIAFGVIRRWQIPWTLVSHVLLGLHNFLVLLI